MKKKILMIAILAFVLGSVFFAIERSMNRTAVKDTLQSTSSTQSIVEEQDSLSVVLSNKNIAWIRTGATACFKALFSPDDRFVACVTPLGIQIYSVPSGRFIKMLPNRLGYGSYPLVFTQDSKNILFGDSSNLRCFNLYENTLSGVLFKQRGFIRSLVLSQSGDTLLVAGDDLTVTGLDLKDSYKICFSLKINGQAWRTEFANNDRVVVVQSGNNEATIIDIASAKVIRTLKANFVIPAPFDDRIIMVTQKDIGRTNYSGLQVQTISGTVMNIMEFDQREGPSHVALNSTGKNLILSSSSGWLKIFDVQSGKLLNTISDKFYYRPFSVSQDGNTIAVDLEDSGFGVWNLTNGILLMKCSERSSSDFKNVSLSNSGRFVCSANANNQITLWEVRSGKELCYLTSHSSPVEKIVSNRDNHLSASLYNNGTAQIWNTQTGMNEYVLSEGNGIPIHELVFSRNGSQMATIASSTIYDPGSERGNYHTDEIKVSLWNSKDVSWIKNLSFKQDDPPSVLEFSQDDKSLIVYNLGKIQIYDIQSDSLMRDGKFDPEGFERIFSSSGKYVIYTEAQSVGQLELWDVLKDSLVLTKTAHNGFIRTTSWDAKDSILVTTGQDDHTLKVWSFPSCQLIRSIDLNAPKIHYGSVSPSGKYFAGGSINGEMDIWDIQSGRIIQKYDEYPCYIHAVSWSPDENLLFTGFQDGTIIAFKTDFPK